MSRRIPKVTRLPGSLLSVVAVTLLSSALWADDGGEHVPELLGGIVGVRTQVPDTARTARTLGTERIGSGVLIDSNGLIVTIGYLILEARSAEVMLASGRRLPAGIVGYDHASGFGLLRAIGPVDLRPIRLGSSRPLEKDAPVLIASFGGTRGVQPAVVTSRREFAGYWEYLLPHAIFTTPPHPAFGGAALLDEQGRLLGIGSLAVNDAQAGEYLPGNMFVPIDRLMPAMADLLTDGRPRTPARPWLGIYTEEARDKLFVAHVASEGPAQRAGILRGDIIIKVAGQTIASMADFYRKVWSLGDAGVDVPLTVLSGSEIKQVEIRSADRYSWLRLPPGN
ncbi:MAG: S1C family serine protease [Gammaproteobacteria bacterium]|nr:S1C family serine protease [Gammaproteobacteria bacterium]